MPARSAGHRRQWKAALYVVMGLLLAVFAGAEARAQEAPTCEALIADAEERYVARAWGDAEELLRECLRRAEPSEAEAVAAYRLLALTYLRQDDVSAAREAVVRLLGVSFEYDADPVQDPPVFVALVASIKDQLRVAAAVDPQDAAEPIEPAPVAEADAEPEEEIASPIIRPRPPPEPEVAPAPEPRARRFTDDMPRWLAIGGGAVAVVVVGVLLANGGSSNGPPGDAPLPPPPALPR